MDQRLENLPVAAWTVSPQGIITGANARARQLFGYPDGMEGVGAGAVFLSPPYGTTDYWRAFIEGAETLIDAEARCSASGYPVTVLLSAVNAGGEALCTGHDITSYKDALNALRLSLDGFRAVSDRFTDGIIVVDAAGIVKYLNKSAEQLLFRNSDELLGKPFGFSIVTDKVTEVRVLRKGAGFGTAEMRSVEALWRREKAYIIFLHDVTEKKMVENELLKAQKLESVGILAEGIAHDFNNLLTGVLANITLAALDVEKNSKAHARIKEAENALGLARGLANQLLGFSKGGAPVKTTIDLNELIRRSVAFSLRGANVASSFEIAEDLKPVEGDENQLVQVLNNIVINARDAMPEGGAIRVSARNVGVTKKDGLPLEEGMYALISIEDRGGGIPDSYLANIFDPYFTTKEKGSGLGLATAYSIVKNHGGHIAVRSAMGEGSVFSVYLPVSERQPARKEGVEEEPPEGSGKVLVMDDDDIVRYVASEILSAMGYTVVAASEGREAVAAYKRAREAGFPFDAVVLDLTVPGGMGGRDTVKEILSIDPGAKAIVSSGYSNDPVMSDYARYGFKGVVTKPYKAIDLCRAVKAVVELKS